MAQDAFWPDGAKKEPPSIPCPMCERLGERATLVEVQDADAPVFKKVPIAA
jgi:hypothetical protein